jgi:hypothetical protein
MYTPRIEGSVEYIFYSNKPGRLNCLHHVMDDQLALELPDLIPVISLSYPGSPVLRGYCLPAITKWTRLGYIPPGERPICGWSSYRNVFVSFGKNRRIAMVFICSNDLKTRKVPHVVPACARGRPSPDLTPRMTHPASPEDDRYPEGRRQVKIDERKAIHERH